MLDPKDISKIGMGTWGIGGLAEHDPKINVQKQIDAIAYALSRGINYVETTFWYAGGHAAKALASALKQAVIKRENIFISQSIYEHNYEKFEDFTKEVDNFHRLIGATYSDALLVTMNGVRKFGTDRVFGWLETQIDQDKTRFVSVTNADLEFLELIQKRFGSKLFGHELHLSFEIRNMADLGITDFADKNNIRNVIYQSLRRGRTAKHNWPLLVELTEKYGATQNQIILAWLIQQGFLPLVKSQETKHIDENLAAMNINLSKQDLTKINEWRSEVKLPPIDWGQTGRGVSPSQLPNIFDEEYEKQHPV